MTRKELAKKDANKVRKDPTLFALFKKFVTEDAKYLYSSGKLPQGCFGCQFNSLFQKWRNHILAPERAAKTKIMGNSKTYELKNKAIKYYFKGKVLSSKSSDSEWIDWINYPIEEDKVAKRKELFSTLPKGLESDETPVDDEPKDNTPEVSENVETTEEVEAKEEKSPKVAETKKPKSKKAEGEPLVKVKK